jgi:hypothetical protein
VVGFGGVEKARVRRGNKLARSVGEFDAGLLNLRTETREGEDAEVVADDSDQAFRAEFGGETPGVVEGVEDERGELQNATVGVVEPGSTREGEDGGRALNGDASELDRTGTEEPARETDETLMQGREKENEDTPCSGVAERSTERVEDGAKKDTILKTDVDEGRGVVLVDTGVDDLSNGDGRRKGGEGLKGERVEGVFGIEGDDADSRIGTPDGLRGERLANFRGKRGERRGEHTK